MYKSHYENVPFEIPENWCWCQFGEYLDVRDGTHDSPKYVDKGFPFVTSKNLNNGRIDFSTAKFISEEDHINFSQRSFVEDGDILFAMIGSIGNPVLVVKDRDFSIKNVALFKPYDRKNTYMEYVLYYLHYIQESLRQDAKGGMQPFIPLNYFRKDLMIPLPPLNEQKKIVSELQKLIALIDEVDYKASGIRADVNKTKSKILDLAISGKLVPQDSNDEPAIELLKRINPTFQPCDNSHYENLPFEVPDGWCWAKINDVTEFIKNGAQIKQFKGASGIPITRIETISNSELDMARMGYANITNGAEYKDYYIKDGDILMSHINSRAHIGKCALCNVGENQIIHGMNLLRIRCSKQILPEYMVHYFRSSTFYNLIEPHIKNAVNQASINITNLQKILIPIPPYIEQKRVALMVDKLFSTIDTITAEL